MMETPTVLINQHWQQQRNTSSKQELVQERRMWTLLCFLSLSASGDVQWSRKLPVLMIMGSHMLGGPVAGALFKTMASKQNPFGQWMQQRPLCMLQSYWVMTSGPVKAVFQQQIVSSTETFIPPNLWQKSRGRVRRTQWFSKFMTNRIGLYYHWCTVQRNRPNKHKFFILPIIIIFCYIAHCRVHNQIVLSRITIIISQRITPIISRHSPFLMQAQSLLYCHGRPQQHCTFVLCYFEHIPTLLCAI